MSDPVADLEEKPVKPGKKPLILAVILALGGAGAGFYAVSTGLIPTGEHLANDAHTPNDASDDSHGNTATHGTGHIDDTRPIPLEDIAFVEVAPVTISLNASQPVQHLIFRAHLEVNANYKRDVEKVLPRVMDVMNSYLRALELDDLTGSLALARLRAQMLRRIQIVTGKGRVRDLLIMEFVLN